jgi:hypothetical protein
MRRLLLVLLPLGACSDPADLPPAEALERVVEMTCNQAHDCRASFPLGEQFFTQIFGASVEACIPLLRDEFRFEATLAAIDAGRILYDGADASACLEWASERTCDELWNGSDETEPTSCQNAFVGTVAEGGTCAVDMECSGDLGCDDADLVCAPQ